VTELREHESSVSVDGCMAGKGRDDFHEGLALPAMDLLRLMIQQLAARPVGARLHVLIYWHLRGLALLHQPVQPLPGRRQPPGCAQLRDGHNSHALFSVWARDEEDALRSTLC
jgi:hypothetical protein